MPANQAFHLPLIGEAMGGLFGVEKLTIHLHLKHPPATFDQFGFGGKRFPQLGGQSGRLGMVVSHYAVFNLDIHQNTQNPMLWWSGERCRGGGSPFHM